VHLQHQPIRRVFFTADYTDGAVGKKGFVSVPGLK
jgi:hypothetical protein